MKLITLNAWGGHVEEPLLKFVFDYADVDIFCFQELYHNAENKISTEDKKVNLNLFAELQRLLPEHKSFFRPVVAGCFGVGIFIKNTLEVIAEGEVIIHHNKNYPGLGPTHSRNLQWIKFRTDSQICHVLNVHGLWNGMGKTDTPERIAQSHKIKEFVDTIKTPKILCGDFNLRPDTQSTKIIEHGMHNLVQIHGIDSTRTSYYTKEEKFADYIFTSNDIKVNSFAVLTNEVSDHAPLLLDFDI